MEREKKAKPGYATPTEFTGLKLTRPKVQAGGIPAVVNALKHIGDEIGWIDGLKTMSKVNQKDGFDCPGCAWPDPDDKRSFLGEYCENGAKAVAEEATTHRVDPDFFRKYSIKELGDQSDYWLGKSGRITQPMVLHPDAKHYEPIDWEKAFYMIGKHLNELASPHEAVFYTSGRTSNEAAFLYQLFVRQFGTNNLPDCSNMCHESSGVALSQTVGIGKGSVTLDDFNHAELIIIAGQNPGTNHPRMLTALQKAKRNGAKIITINPLEEAGLIKFKHPQHIGDIVGSPTSITDLFLQVKINEDVALMKAILKGVLEQAESDPSILDAEFIQTHTAGFDEFRKDLNQYNFKDLVAQSGVESKEIKAAIELIVSRKKIIFCWAMGLTQHRNAVDNIREAVNLLLLRGSIGKPGAGTCPVRGHSNVQGDRTMGIWERPKPEFLDQLGSTFNFDPPREIGLNTVEAINAMSEGKIKVFIGMGGNFLSAAPDTALTAQALQQCDLTVQISTKLNRSHVVTGKTALILPCLGRTEKDFQEGGYQFVSVENSTGVVHQSKGNKSPASPHLRSEPKIIAGMAKATLKERSTVNYDELTDHYDAIREVIEKVIPGFEKYNSRVRHPGGFYLPNGARERKFKTKNEKANFTINQLSDLKLNEGELMMMTIRSHDQFNTTIYGLDDRYRGIYHERRVVLMNKDDIEQMKFQEKEVVDLISRFNGKERVAEKFIVVPYNIPRRCVATYFPEANMLVPIDHFANISHTPASKSVIISIRRHKKT